jgi:hypothetical protein
VIHRINIGLRIVFVTRRSSAEVPQLLRKRSSISWNILAHYSVAHAIFGWHPVQFVLVSRYPTVHPQSQSLVERSGYQFVIRSSGLVGRWKGIQSLRNTGKDRDGMFQNAMVSRHFAIEEAKIAFITSSNCRFPLFVLLLNNYSTISPVSHRYFSIVQYETKFELMELFQSVPVIEQFDSNDLGISDLFQHHQHQIVHRSTTRTSSITQCVF